MRNSMKKRIIALIMGTLIVSTVIPEGVLAVSSVTENAVSSGIVFDKDDYQIIKSYKVSEEESKNVEKALKLAKDNGKDAAEILNKIEDEKDFEFGVKKVLNNYYYGITEVDSELIKFEKYIDDRAEKVLSQYKEALEERKKAVDEKIVPGEIIVHFKPDVSDEYITDIINEISEGGEIITNKYNINKTLPEEKITKLEEVRNNITNKMVKVNICKGEKIKEAIDKYEKLDCVIDAGVNGVLEKDDISDLNDTYAMGQWYLDRINIDDAWDSVECAINASRIRVAVIDTGLQMNHPDLNSRIIQSLSVDITGSSNVLLSNMSTPYVNSHGTEVTSVIAANVNNGIGIAGVAGISPSGNAYNCRIMAVQAYTLQTDGNYKISVGNLCEAIEYAIANGADIINLSMQMETYNRDVENYMNAAYSAGITIIASAGNTGSSNTVYPAAFNNVISVIASDTTDSRASFSSYGNHNNLSAPGFSIQTASVGSGYTTVDGTSFAAPMVSGTAMMMKSINNNLSPTEIKNILETTATDVGPVGFDSSTGYGILNSGLAVQKAKYLTFSTTAPVINNISSVGTGKIGFNWNLVGNEERYNVYRSTSLNGTYTNVKAITVNSSNRITFTDINLVSGQRYYYKIWCKAKYGNDYVHGPYSAIVSCVAN